MDTLRQIAKKIAAIFRTYYNMSCECGAITYFENENDAVQCADCGAQLQV